MLRLEPHPRLGHLQERRGWPGHRRAKATPSFRRLCPAMTKDTILVSPHERRDMWGLCRKTILHIAALTRAAYCVSRERTSQPALPDRHPAPDGAVEHLRRPLDPLGGG